MAEKKHVYESNVIGLPPLHLVLGNIPSPDPERRKGKQQEQGVHELELPVKKLIAHLKDEKK